MNKQTTDYTINNKNARSESESNTWEIGIFSISLREIIVLYRTTVTASTHGHCKLENTAVRSVIIILLLLLL